MKKYLLLLSVILLPWVLLSYSYAEAWPTFEAFVQSSPLIMRVKTERVGHIDVYRIVKIYKGLYNPSRLTGTDYRFTPMMLISTMLSLANMKPDVEKILFFAPHNDPKGKWTIGASFVITKGKITYASTNNNLREEMTIEEFESRLYSIISPEEKLLPTVVAFLVLDLPFPKEKAEQFEKTTSLVRKHIHDNRLAESLGFLCSLLQFPDSRIQEAAEAKLSKLSGLKCKYSISGDENERNSTILFWYKHWQMSLIPERIKKDTQAANENDFRIFIECYKKKYMGLSEVVYPLVLSAAHKSSGHWLIEYLVLLQDPRTAYWLLKGLEHENQQVVRNADEALRFLLERQLGVYQKEHQPKRGASHNEWRTWFTQNGLEIFPDLLSKEEEKTK